jgi:epoxide hydrolase-like predicted phosphatase
MRMKNAPDADFVVFDLGNVIIDLDFERAFSLIKSQIPATHHTKVDDFYLADFHKAYERGAIDSATFRDAIRTHFGQTWEDSKVDELWNSILGKIPAKRLELLTKLKENYKLAVLSNTNAIHIDAVYALLQTDHRMERFEPLFDRIFYSHEMGLAKPSIEIYERMLAELGTTADRVIFFDDLKANVEAAASLGINAVQVTGPHVIFDFFGHV